VAGVMAATLRDHTPVAKPTRNEVRYAVRVTTHAPIVHPRPRWYGPWNGSQNPHVRRATRVLALVPALLVTTSAGAALAAPPESWESPKHTSPLYVILVLGAIPVALFVLITLLVYLPSMTKGRHSQPGQEWGDEVEWFGGPREGLEAVRRHDAPAVTAGSGSSGATSAGATSTTAVDSGATGSGPSRGGTSGRW
jgi:hypothetical protein